MSENHKNDMINEETSDETKVLPLAEIDAQMKDAYKLLNKQKNEKASDEHVAVEENENADQLILGIRKPALTAPKQEKT